MKKEHQPTAAQILFKDKDLLVARPEGMTYKDYVFLRRHQTRIIHKLFRHKPNRKLLNIMR